MNIVISLLTLIIVASQSDDDIKVFLQWLKDNGAYFDPLVWPIEFPSIGRGVQATRNIKENEVFLKIPLNLTIHNASNPSLFPITQKLDEQDGLILNLITEKRKQKNSFWFPYINILPTSFDSVGYWSDLELKEIQSKELIKHAQSQNYYWVKDLKNMNRLLVKNNLLQISLDEYKWGQTIAETRCFVSYFFIY